MTKIIPFRAIRPRADLSSQVAELPYDVMSSDEARVIAKDNPYSFLHVDKSEIDLPLGTDIHSTPVYEKARDNFRAMIRDGVLVKDPERFFYIYAQRRNGHLQKGIVLCAWIDDYMEGRIKKHELTLAEKETDRIHHVDYTSANTGPIFLTYRRRQEIDEIVEDWSSKKEPIFDFVAPDSVEHRGWLIDDQQVIDRIVELFEGVDALYIADGHHRCASAVDVGLMRRVETKTIAATKYNFF